MIRAIGSAAIRFPKRMLAALVLALVVFGVVGGGVEKRLSVGGFVDPNAESTKVADALEDRFETGAYGFVLVLRPFEEWVYSESNRPEGERITTAIEEEPGVVEVASYYNLPEPTAPAISPLRDGFGNHALVAVKLEGSEDEQRLTAARLYETYVEPGNERFEVRSTGAVEVSRAAAEEAEKDLQRA